MEIIIKLILISILTLIFIYILAKIFIKTSLKIFEFIKEFLWDFIFIIFLVLIFVLLIIATLPYFMDFMDVVSWLSDFISLHKKYEISFEKLTTELELSRKQKGQELHNQFISNFSWIIWTIFSLFALLITFGLTIWGRIMQNGQWKIQNDTHKLQLESHLQERYENSCSMLGNEVMAVRIAGCQALKNLTIDDKSEDNSMKLQCARLLFAFIWSPYLGDDEKESARNEHEGESAPDDDEKNKKLDDPTTSAPPARLSKSKLLEYVFPSYEILRDDIQEAADIISLIYEKYGDEELYKEKILLPDYFLKNRKKNSITLIKANLKKIDSNEVILKKANLQEAILEGVNLQEAKLWEAKLQKANLQFADLRETELWGAKLQEANLFAAKLEGADLAKADLQKANMRNANISFAFLKTVQNLTKEQVLSAIWGIYESGEGKPPDLPEELENDIDVIDWLTTPHYDLKKIYNNDDDDYN